MHRYWLYRGPTVGLSIRDCHTCEMRPNAWLTHHKMVVALATAVCNYVYVL